MHKAELSRLLQAEMPDSQQLGTFLELLNATLHYESQQRLRGLKASYEPLDPDSLTQRCEPLDPAARELAADDLFKQFAHLLELCNYRKLRQEELEESLHSASDWGVNLHIDFSMFRQLDCYVCNEKVDHYTRSGLLRRWKKEQVELPVYGRLAVIFELHDEAATESEHVQPQQVYLKLFKNIPKQDVDMLLPGARVRMTWLDQGKIILPTVTGLGVTGLKLFKGAVIAAAFAGVYGMLGFLALVGGTIGYALKSFFGYQRTKEKYHLHLHRNLYYQNLANGRSVLFHLLDEAQEQEFQEAALAYCMLWQSEAALSAAHIDEAAESFLQEQAGCSYDFDIAGALEKLERLRLAEQHHGHWQAVPLGEAVARLDHAWDNLFQGSSEPVAKLS